MTDRVQTKLTESATYAGYLRDKLRQAHAVGTAVESLLLLPMIQRATELERDIQALLNARERSDKIQFSETEAELSKCGTCKHDTVAGDLPPCTSCLARNSLRIGGRSNNWEPKP